MKPVRSAAQNTFLNATTSLNTPIRRIYSAAANLIDCTAFGYSSVGHGAIFNGLAVEHVTGLYLLGNGFRAYSPFLLRYYSSDKFSPLGKGGLNNYAYCGNDPINYGDPSGKFRVSRLFARLRRLLSGRSTRSGRPATAPAPAPANHGIGPSSASAAGGQGAPTRARLRHPLGWIPMDPNSGLAPPDDMLPAVQDAIELARPRPQPRLRRRVEIMRPVLSDESGYESDRIR